MLGFRDEVIKQREEEISLLSRLSKPIPHAKKGDAIVVLLLVVSVALMLLVPIAV